MTAGRRGRPREAPIDRPPDDAVSADGGMRAAQTGRADPAPDSSPSSPVESTTTHEPSDEAASPFVGDRPSSKGRSHRSSGREKSRLPIAYCEACGVAYEVTGPGLLPFRTCAECLLLRCPACWGASNAEQCADCVRVAGPVALMAPPVRSRDFRFVDARSAAIFVVASLVGAVAVGAAGGLFGDQPSGAVLEATGRPAETAPGVAQASVPPSTAESTATPTSAPTATPRASSAPPPTSTPVASAAATSGATPANRVTVLQSTLVTWEDSFGEVRAQVIGEVENRGGTAVRIPSGGTGYTIIAPNGLTVASGRFAHAFPPIVAAGGRAFLIDALAATFVDRSDLASVQIDVRSEPVAESATLLTVEALHWTVSQGPVVVSGQVRNDGATPVGPVAVGALLRDRADRILCGVYSVDHVALVGPGQSAAFSTSYPEVQLAVPTDAVRAEAVAFVRPGG
jgi:hypothetical protein